MDMFCGAKEEDRLCGEPNKLNKLRRFTFLFEMKL